MSGSQTPMAKPPKTMSSRLLTMKFMQRAAASASPVAPGEPPLKLQRLSSSPASPATPSLDLQATPASQEVLNRQAAEAGETRWVLSFQDSRETSNHKCLRVVGTGFAGLDDPRAGELKDDEEYGQGWRGNRIMGRKRFGNFKRAWEGYARLIDVEKIYQTTKEPPQDEHAPSSDKVSDSEGDDGADDHPLPPDNRKDMGDGRKVRYGALKEARKEAEEERREKRLLRGISSISGGGGQGEHQQSGRRKEAQCFKCGELGHMARDCMHRR